MDTLARALADIAMRAGLTPAEVQSAMQRPSLEELQRVGPTEHIIERVDTIRASVLEHGDAESQQAREARRSLGYWERRLQLAVMRDAIQDERPDGCWCLGLGGRGRVGIVVWDPTTPGRVLYSEDPAPLSWSTYCDACEEGQSARAYADDERERMRREGDARRASRVLGAARIPPEYDRWDLATFPDRELAVRVERWYDERPKPWLLFEGPHGSGKTTLAVGLVKLALERGHGPVFRTVPDVLDELRSSYDPDDPASHSGLMAALRGAELLVLDDLGAERMTGWVEERMFQLLNARHNDRRGTVITTNLEGEALAEHIGERSWWRIKAMANRVKVDGNLRVKP